MNKENWVVIFRRDAEKKLKELDKELRRRILKKLVNLKENPFKVESTKLKGFNNVYRIRVGNVRVIYEIVFEERIIFILKIDFRGRVYKNL